MIINDQSTVTRTIVELGKKLDFSVGTEIQASDSAWVDVVWFDARFDFGPKKADTWTRVQTWRQPVIPVVGFEIEASAAAKPVKGSVANLNALGASMGIIVLGEENLNKIRKRATAHRKESDEKIWEFLSDRTIQWVREARPITRVVIMTEEDVVQWEKSVGTTIKL